MTRSELIQIMSTKQNHLSEREMELAVKCLLEEMTKALSVGHRIEIRGFGSFSIRFRKACKARNPKTGAIVQKAAKHSIHFKAGKEMRERVMQKMETL
jgi:integration host factor subunit beta